MQASSFSFAGSGQQAGDAGGPPRLPLAEMPLLFLDGQSTGAAPPGAQLLELCWCRASAALSGDPPLEGGLLRLAGDKHLPAAIHRLTGLSDTDLSGQPSAQERWAVLLDKARADGLPSPVVIHFARFEERFLRQLHDEQAPLEPFPLELICTHAIVARLHPELPRRGLRAIAGYYGGSSPELHRAADHLRATLVIWSGVVPELQRQGVGTLDDLRRWLRRSMGQVSRQARGAGRFSFPMARACRLDVPEEPGVYHLLGARGELLYVGKASCLRERVSAHFTGRGPRQERELELLTRARDLRVTVTASALEAALLEVDQIQSLGPPYNRALRDRGERPCFMTAELGRVSREPDAKHCLGPVLGEQALRPLQLLRRWLDGDRSAVEDWREALGLPAPPRGPSDRTILDGVRSFFALHPWSHRLDAGRALLRLGRRLFALRADEARRRSEDPVVLVLESPQLRRWTGERVVESVALALLRGTHLLRRGSWLCELSEARLTWELPSGSRRTLHIQAGAVLVDGADQSLRDLRLPARAASLDAPACERLRVLSTELRRLCRQGRWLELHLGPRRRPMQRDLLARRLLWV